MSQDEQPTAYPSPRPLPGASAAAGVVRLQQLICTGAVPVCVVLRPDGSGVPGHDQARAEPVLVQGGVSGKSCSAVHLIPMQQQQQLRQAPTHAATVR